MLIKRYKRFLVLFPLLLVFLLTASLVTSGY